MPAGLIKHKHHIGIISGLLTYKPKMMIHVVSVFTVGAIMAEDLPFTGLTAEYINPL